MIAHFRPPKGRASVVRFTHTLLVAGLPASAFLGSGYAQASQHQQNTHTARAVQTGLASWYGGSVFQSKRTAQGQRFDHHALTAAHRTLPFGTKVLVQSPKTHRSVIVTINDRGPFTHHRIIDLSRGAAEQLGMMKHGVVPVSLTILRPSLPIKEKHS